MTQKPASAPRARPRPKGPRRGRPTGQFTQYRRLEKLRKLLEAHPQGLSLEELGVALHVTTRSVRRYLEELEEVSQVELDSVPTSPGGPHLWRIKPSERGRALFLRRTQAYGLLAARAVFEPMRGSALFDELDIAARQLLLLAQRPQARGNVVRGEIAGTHRLEDRLLYVPHAPRNYASRGEDLDALFQAVAELRVVSFRTPDGDHVTAQPYAMVLHRGAIVCVARDVDTERVGAFPFETLGDLTVHDELFDLPERFDVREVLDGEFGITPAPSRRVRVLVEFDARVADEVRRARLHPTQRIAVAPDGRVRLSMSVGNVDEVRRWILGFGGAARVIEPVELVASVREAALAAAARYRT